MSKIIFTHYLSLSFGNKFFCNFTDITQNEWRKCFSIACFGFSHSWRSFLEILENMFCSFNGWYKMPIFCVHLNVYVYVVVVVVVFYCFHFSGLFVWPRIFCFEFILPTQILFMIMEILKKWAYIVCLMFLLLLLLFFGNLWAFRFSFLSTSSYN